MSIRPIVYGILMWAVCIYAFRRGGWAEKSAAVGIVVISYLSVIVNLSDPAKYHHVEWDIIIIDSAFFLMMMFIVARSEKYWPMWLAALQGVTVLCHFASVAPGIQAWVYFNSNALWSYPMLIILGFAIRRHHRDIRAGL